MSIFQAVYLLFLFSTNPVCRYMVSHQQTPYCSVPSKILEIFSKSCRILQDSWNKSRNLGGFSKEVRGYPFA